MPKQVDISREQTYATLVYDNSTTPTAYIDKGRAVIITALIPAAFQNVAFTPQFAKAAAPASAAAGIPRCHKTDDTYGSMVGDTVPAGGSWYIFQADNCGSPFWGLVFGGQVTGTIELWLTG